MPRIFVLILLVPLVSWAQVRQELSLSEAERLWQAHSHELQLARLAVQGAQADVQAAAQRPNPELAINTLSISPSEGWGAGGVKHKRMDTQIRLDQLLERGGKRDLRMQSASARLAAAGQDEADTLRQQRAMLRTAYHDLHLAQDRQQMARESAALYAQSAQAASLRQKAGDLAPVDLARLMIDRQRAESDARQAEAALEQAQAALAYLIGKEAEAQHLLTVDPWPEINDAALADARLAARPDLEAARHRMEAAERERDLARAKRVRDITLGVQVERNLQNAPTNSFGLGVSVPLFVWHEYEGEIGRAEAEFEAARQQYAQLQSLAGTQVMQTRSALLAARERLQRLQNGLLADAEKVAKAAEFAYTKGAMGLLDVLDARRTLRQVQIEAATARADYAKAWSDWQLQAEYGKEK